MDKQRQCIENGECRPRHRSRKDRARLCGGREGREHQWEWVDENTLPNKSHWMKDRAVKRHFIRERKVCTVCKRQEGSRLRCQLTMKLAEGWIPTKCSACGASEGPGTVLF